MKSDFCLTSPVRLGAYTLRNRIVIAPNLRSQRLCEGRSQADNHLLQPEAVACYGNRASCGLIITEPILVTPSDEFLNYSGIFTRQQLHSWRTVTEEVRKQNGRIFSQLWYKKKAKRLTYVKRSEIVEIFRIAAQNALTAEFDGVEISFDFNYLSDRQLEMNIQLLLSILEDVISVWDENKVGIRLTSDQKILATKDVSLSSNLYDLLDALDFYEIAYLHLTDSMTRSFCQTPVASAWLNILRSIYSGRFIIDYQDSYKSLEDAIVKYSPDLISFNDL